MVIFDLLVRLMFPCTSNRLFWTFLYIFRRFEWFSSFSCLYHKSSGVFTTFFYSLRPCTRFNQFSTPNFSGFCFTLSSDRFFGCYLGLLPDVSHLTAHSSPVFISLFSLFFYKICISTLLSSFGSYYFSLFNYDFLSLQNKPCVTVDDPLTKISD